MKNHFLFAAAFIVLAPLANAQVKDTVSKADDEDFSAYADANEKPVKRFVGQKILWQTPAKLVSVGYEYQGSFDLNNSHGGVDEAQKGNVGSIGGIRLAANVPVISNQRIIWQLGGFYWQSQYNNVTGNSGVANSLATGGLHDAALTSTFFIPLNEKNFLIMLGQAEAASNGPGLDISSRSLTWSMAAVYGWKKRDDLMWGLGFTRGYRMGKVITVPLLMYNRSFNKKWGLESLLPIRMNVRYSIKPNSLLLAGYELEGAQYAIDDSPAYADIRNTYLQRGEIKARLSYERSLYKFIWLSAQAGMRVNGRFNFSPNYNGDEYKTTSVLGNPFYFNIGINWVSP